LKNKLKLCVRATVSALWRVTFIWLGKSRLRCEISIWRGKTYLDCENPIWLGKSYLDCEKAVCVVKKLSES
jgi:hypothetical protein